MVNTEFYKNGKIYKIVDNTNGAIYIGSTCKLLSQRIAQHRADYKRYLEGKYHNIKSFDILRNNDYRIVLVEKLENCNSKEELLKRERYYIESLECVNKNTPTRTPKEYYEDNKNKILSYKKEYRKDNKNKISNNKKEYYNKNKQSILNKMKTKIKCDICDCFVCKSDFKKHERSKKHINNQNNKQTYIELEREFEELIK